MTQNQINFARLQEEKRHNLATEGLANVTYDETVRHNKSSEGFNWYSAEEQARHNKDTEAFNWYKGQYDTSYTAMRTKELEQTIRLDQAKLDLDLAKFEEQKWKDLWTTWNDSKRVQIAEQQASAQIEEWARRYAFDESKWTVQRWESISKAISNGVQAGKSLADILKAVAGIVAAG